MIQPTQGEPFLVIGYDPSPRASAVVALMCNEHGDVESMRWLAFCKTKRQVKQYPDGEYVMVPKEFSDKKLASGDFDRHRFVLETINQFLKQLTPNYKPNNIVSVFEGYAMGAIGRTFLIGECQGLLRMQAYNMGLMRLYDIQGIKQFATGNGGAEKEEMLQAYYMVKNTLIEETQLQVPFEEITDDLCDAWWIAQMLHVEIMLRHGFIDMKTLTPNARNFFNRVTDKDPVNVLARPFQTFLNYERVMK